MKSGEIYRIVYTAIYQKVENTTMDIIHHDPINQFEGSLESLKSYVYIFANQKV